MKSKFAKRLAALLLTLVMSLGLLVPGAFAAATVNKVVEKQGDDGQIVVTVYNQAPVEGNPGIGTGGQVSNLSTPVDGVGINALRIGSVVELTSTDTDTNTVSTQVAFGLSQEICSQLGLNPNDAIASKEDNGTTTYYFAPKVVQDALTTANGAAEGASATQATIEAYLNAQVDASASNAFTATTNGEGVATFDNPEADTGLTYGLYLLAKSELPADATTDLVPFLVSVPMYVEDAGTWNKEVYAYPKVRTAEITLTKTVDDDDTDTPDYNDDNSGDIYVNAGQTLEYTVTVNIPAVEKGNNAPTKFERFVITDTNDNHTLNLDEAVKQGTESALVLQLQSGTDASMSLKGITEAAYKNIDNNTTKATYDYYYTYDADSAPGDDSVLTITFTDTGLEKLNANLSKTDSTKNPLDQTLTITYDATVATDVATFSNTLVNTAALSYKREGMEDPDTSKSDAVTLYTYGIDLTKTLSDNAGISEDEGNKITFTLYTDNTLTTAVPVLEVGDSYWVAASGSSIMSVKADESNQTLGNLTLYGLEPGTYYLKETATMDGYALLDKPIEIKIDKDQSEDIKATATINGATATDDPAGVFKLSVENTKLTAGFALPQTGGAGTLAVTAIGLGLLCVAIVLLVVYRKKGNKNS